MSPRCCLTCPALWATRPLTAPTTTFTPLPTSWTPTPRSPGRASHCCRRWDSNETRPENRAPDFFRFARDYRHAYMPKTRGLSPKTIEAYRISLECFLGYLAETEHVERDRVSFDHFDRQHLKGWLTWMTDQRRYSPKTVMLRLSAVKAFLAYASHEDITLVALSQAAKVLKAPIHPKTPIEYLTEPQTRAILAAFTGQTTKSRRNRMLLILLYDTAARVGECNSCWTAGGVPSRSATSCATASQTSRRGIWCPKPSIRPSTCKDAADYAVNSTAPCVPAAPCAGHGAAQPRCRPARFPGWS